MTDPALELRVTDGIAPDGKFSPFSPSTRFKSYKQWLDARKTALKEIEAGNSQQGVAVNLSKAPGIDGNMPGIDVYEIFIDYPGKNLGEGFVGVGPKTTKNVTVGGITKTNKKAYNSTAPIDGLYRVKTTVSWDPVANKWVVSQHYPSGVNYDAATGTYTVPANIVR